ncbi:hypothetical protein ZWY2020_025479 [Hordeum vulgare]|nr:hypothetical protein ZWY2020_025479 [Hordeum vulgare]
MASHGGVVGLLRRFGCPACVLPPSACPRRRLRPPSLRPHWRCRRWWPRQWRWTPARSSSDSRAPPSASRSSHAVQLRCALDDVVATTAEPEQQPREEEEFVLLASNRNDFNEVIMVIDSPSDRYLVLDPSRNVHNIFPKKIAWTNSYWVVI